MPGILIQRRDKAGYLERYPVYINRKQVGRLGFGETFHLDLQPGRYQLHCGGLFGKEGETWIDLSINRKAFFLSAEKLVYRQRPYPKYYRLKFTETTPMQLKGEEEQGQLKAEQRSALVFAFAFLSLLSLASAWFFWQALESQDSLFNYFGIFCLALIPWAYRGVLLSRL